jgi:hypothetical protein
MKRNAARQGAARSNGEGDVAVTYIAPSITPANPKDDDTVAGKPVAKYNRLAGAM